MTTLNDVFEAKLRKRIGEVVAVLKDELSASIANDLNRHNHIIGKIAGLESVFSLCDEVQSEINKR